MVGERDVLAEALRDIDPDADGNLDGDPLLYFGRWADRLLADLAARGWRLVPSACPIRLPEICYDPTCAFHRPWAALSPDRPTP